MILLGLSFGNFFPACRLEKCVKENHVSMHVTYYTMPHLQFAFELGSVSNVTERYFPIQALIAIYHVRLVKSVIIVTLIFHHSCILRERFLHEHNTRLL